MFIDSNGERTILEIGGAPYSTKSMSHSYRYVLTKKGTFYKVKELPELSECFPIGNVDELAKNNPENVEVIETNVDVSKVVNYLKHTPSIYDSLNRIKTYPKKIVPSDGVTNTVEILDNFNMSCNAMVVVMLRFFRDVINHPEYQDKAQESDLEQVNVYLDCCFTYLNLYKILYDACASSHAKERIKTLLRPDNFDTEKFFKSKGFITKSNLYDFKKVA